MSELQTEMATNAMAPAAVVARPRISADAFRNLTARLKKSDVVVPNMVVPVIAMPATIVVEPVVTAPAAAEVLPDAVLEVSQPVAEVLAFEPPASVVNSDVDLDGLAAAEALAAAEKFSAVADLPVEMIPLEVKVDDVVVTEVDTPAVSAEPELDGSFADNFTYVPEPGNAVEQAEAAEALKKEVAERAIQLELENIWRLLLAKPTSDDRAVYLREVAEFNDPDEEVNKPAPEHDLSRIEPADLTDDIVLTSAIPNGDGLTQRSFSDALPVAEGQDLAELTRSLLDMMASGNSAGLPQERALAADTLLRLVPRLEMKPLILLAQRLSIMENPPHLLTARLIRDPRVEVAGPLLEDCAHLTDKDIASVVEEGAPAKLRMIARRRKLSRHTSDALIKSGEPSVVLTLVRNMDAEISHDGFQSLLVLCENHEELLAPLATRHDFLAPFAFELFWLAPAQLRRFILSRFLTDSETLTKILKITMATQTDDDAEPEPMNQHALLEGLERAARGHVEVASEELSQIMQVNPATMTRILSDLQGDAIVIMLKAAGYPRSAVAGLLKRMQDADLPLVTRERDVAELQIMFETMSFNKARILLTYWDWAQGKTGPYAPVH